MHGRDRTNDRNGTNGGAGDDRTDGDGAGRGPAGPRPLGRRAFLGLAGAAGVAGATAALAGCARGGPARTTGQPVRIGFVSPRSGVLAAFGEADDFVVQEVQRLLDERGIPAPGGNRPVQILTRDCQSDPGRARTVAETLIRQDEVDLVLATADAGVINPVADVCERAGVPCLSTVAQWETVHRRGASRPEWHTGWHYTRHFYSGVKEILWSYTAMWEQLRTNHQVGAVWSDDGVGRALTEKVVGFPGQLATRGFELPAGDLALVPGGVSDFSGRVRAMRDRQVEIITGSLTPPDFATFWRQADTQKLRPRIVTSTRALLFPSFVEAMRPSAEGLSTEVSWSPRHPFRSSLTGQGAQRLADDYTARTGKQWTQPLGFVHALLELAVHALTEAGDPSDRRAVANSLRTARLDTIVGLVDFNVGPVPGVAITHLVGGQWVRGDGFPFDLRVVDTTTSQEIPAGGKLRPLSAPA